MAIGSVFSNRRVTGIMVKTEQERRSKRKKAVSTTDQLRRGVTSGEEVLALVPVAWLLREEILILWKYCVSLIQSESMDPGEIYERRFGYFESTVLV